jgi:hypothetical protein
MRYEAVKGLKPGQFKRATGVSRRLFLEMLGLVQSHQGTMGRPAKLSLADQLMATLMYWREYRTQFHIGQSYGVSEPTVNRIINKVENILIGSGKFNLPSKGKLEQSDLEYQFIWVDASETPIERPKKSRNSSTAARRSDTPLRPR